MNHIPKIICWKLYIPDSDDFYIKEQDKFETELHNGHFDFEKIRGKTDDTKYIYFLPNITKEDSEGISGHFQHVYSYRKNQNSHSAKERQKELDDFLTSRKLKDEFSLSLTVLSENFFKKVIASVQTVTVGRISPSVAMTDPGSPPLMYPT